VSELPPPRLARLRSVADDLLPLGTKRRDTVSAAVQFLKAGRRLGLDSAQWLRQAGDVAVAGAKIVAATGVALPEEPYPLWLARHRSGRVERRAQEKLSQGATDPVRVSVVIIGGAHGDSVAATERSLGHQTWGHLDIVTATDWAPAMAAAASGNGRDFVVFAQAGDRFEQDWAFHIADTAWRDPLVDLVYWDDDLLGPAGLPTDPRLRPAWSPEMLLGANYLGRSFAIRRRRLQAVQEAGGMRPELGDDGLWDLLLRSRLGPEQVARTPRILTHLPTRDDAVTERGLSAVRNHLAAQGETAVVEAWHGMARVGWRPREWPLVSIIIPTRHNRPLLQRCLASLDTTDYPAFEVVVIDNGGQTDERDQWYEQALATAPLRVSWWDEPFNYSAVNNAAATLARGQVLVFLNDDTEAIDAAWLKEMVSWALRPEIAVVGMQLLDGEGRIQHGGVVLAMRGLAEHLFQGMAPGAPSLLGPTTWYRNMLAATGACLAITKADFEAVGGFDERFVLCGSDVVLGLDTVALGRRNVCLPFPMMRHYEGLTRSNFVPTGDVFASYWPYQRWIFGGDPYFSPHLSLESSTPRLKPLGELTPAARLTKALGRNFEAYRQRDDEMETKRMAATCRASSTAVAANQGRVETTGGALDVRTVNWFVPDIDSPFYGGISTALRIADHLARHHGVDNRFVLWAGANEPFIRSALAAAFPSLASAPIFFHDSPVSPALHQAPAADVAIATQWVTAYSVTNFTQATRKAYLIQDFEPMFYPAGTLFALAEATYKMGLYGICNSPNLERMYRENYQGQGMAFTPAVDRSVFHPNGRAGRGRGDPVTVFLYSRPGHWRNCWELASVALAEAKARLGDRVRFVTAGSWARPGDIGTGITHLGLLDYRSTGALYRTCDIGIALTVSEHPSYLPLELMASGAAVIAFDKKPFSWLLRDGENCLRVPLNVDGLVDAIVRLVDDQELRLQLAKQALADIDRDFSDWQSAIGGIYDYLCDPDGD
jgi:GT2 family glycosyltransferase/glycosyltransferase involved in cell wall biosynthesis